MAGYLSAYIDQTVAREMYADIDSVTAITVAPPGKAVKTKDGFVAQADGRSGAAASTRPGWSVISQFFEQYEN